MKSTITNLYRNILPAKQFALLTVVLNDTRSYNLQLVTEKNETLFINEFYQGLTKEELIKYLKLEVPLLISFQGDKVISKAIDKNKPLDSLLFNESKDDFYISSIPYTDRIYVSIMRKTVIDESLEGFMQEGYTVLDFSIGPFIAILLKEFIAKDVLVSQETILSFEGGSLHYQKNIDEPTLFKLGEDKLSAYQLPLIATYFNFKNAVSFIADKQERLALSISEFKKQKIFITTLMAILFTVLISLLVSTYLKDTYQDAYADAESQLFFLENSYKEIIALEEEKEELQSLVTNLSGFSEEYYTHYIYYLTRSIPDGLRINSIELNPLSSSFKKGEDVTFTLNTISITGAVAASSHLNRWTQLLKNSSWVHSLEILELYKSRNNDLEFTLQVNF